MRWPPAIGIVGGGPPVVASSPEFARRSVADREASAAVVALSVPADVPAVGLTPAPELVLVSEPVVVLVLLVLWCVVPAPVLEMPEEPLAPVEKVDPRPDPDPDPMPEPAPE